MNYQDENAPALDRWVGEGWGGGPPLSPQPYAAALRGGWGRPPPPPKPGPPAPVGGRVRPTRGPPPTTAAAPR